MTKPNSRLMGLMGKQQGRAWRADKEGKEHLQVLEPSMLRPRLRVRKGEASAREPSYRVGTVCILSSNKASEGETVA